MPSFDVVSEVNAQEVKNAVEQAKKEIGTRYDFRGSQSSIELEDPLIKIVADDKMKLEAIQEVLKQRLAKRNVSLKSVTFGDPVTASGGTLRQEVTVKQGLTDDEMKRINKLIKEMKTKVTSQIQGSQIRVSGKKRDDLQMVIQSLRGSVQDVDLQFVNFRD